MFGCTNLFLKQSAVNTPEEHKGLGVYWKSFGKASETDQAFYGSNADS